MVRDPRLAPRRGDFRIWSLGRMLAPRAVGAHNNAQPSQQMQALIPLIPLVVMRVAAW